MSNSRVVLHWVWKVAQRFQWYCTLSGTDQVLSSFQPAGFPQLRRHQWWGCVTDPLHSSRCHQGYWDRPVLCALLLLRQNSHPALWKQRISEKGNTSITKDAAKFDNLPVRTRVLTHSLYIYYLRTQAHAVPNPSHVCQGLMCSFFADLPLNTK